MGGKEEEANDEPSLSQRDAVSSFVTSTSSSWLAKVLICASLVKSSFQMFFSYLKKLFLNGVTHVNS